MIVFSRLADHWNGQWFRVKKYSAHHGVIQRALGRYHYQPAWCLFAFPIGKGRYIKVMFIKFWRRGWYE